MCSGPVRMVCIDPPAAEAMVDKLMASCVSVGFSTTADEDRSSFCIEPRGGLRHRLSKEGWPDVIAIGYWWRRLARGALMAVAAASDSALIERQSGHRHTESTTANTVGFGH